MLTSRCFVASRKYHLPAVIRGAALHSAASFAFNDTSKNEAESMQPAFKVKGIADKYNPRDFEKARYDACMSTGCFSSRRPSKLNFSMLLPPPNVTGSLHLGHVLTVAIQDAIVRHRRMAGHNVNWLPGLDHAGIATQVQVEKHLASTQKYGNRTRRDIGRERFVQECHVWKEERAVQIIEQLKRIGASLNWDRQTFTLDPYIVENVERLFTELFDRGLIYREKMLVMHCPYLCSTISDIEVDWLDIYKEQDIAVPSFPGDFVRFGYMLHFAYPLTNNDQLSTKTAEIVVATTRPETMLGDVAVAVHPDDARYAHLVGRQLDHPIVPGKRISVISDPSVDPSFGTGAVKITPAHDFNDFSVGKRSGLTLDEQVIDMNGNIACKTVPELHGKNRFHARKVIEQMLNDRGLVRLHESNVKTRVPLCSRSQDIVEPMLKEQWFLKTSELECQAKEAVDSEQLQFTPPFFANVFRNWMHQRQDWCLSRQLWWGIQIPAYRATTEAGNSVWVCARDKNEARQKAVEKLTAQNTTSAEQSSITIERDADVLDTWYSSALLPFLTSTDAESPTYPLSLMETGHDILFFWVARMVMLGLACTGKLPFNHVLLHGLLCDEHGKKMTKSKGNVIDPMKILCSTDRTDAYDSPSTFSNSDFAFDIGADAMRFALLRHDNLAVQLDFNVKTDIDAANRFCNKIWQSVRFVLAAWEANGCEPGSQNNRFLSFDEILRHPSTSPIDRWLVSRLACTANTVDDELRYTFRMQRATEALHRFWLENVCDVYIECIKPFVKRSDSASSSDFVDADRISVILSVLHHVVSGFLHIMHPFMPFITDELYEQTDRYNSAGHKTFGSLCVARFPTRDSLAPLVNADNDERFDILLRCVHEVRSLKSRYNVMNLPVPVRIFLRSNITEEFSTLCLSKSFLDSLKTELCILMRSPPVEVVEYAGDEVELYSSYAVCAVTRNVSVAVKLEGFIDYEKERERVLKKRAKSTVALEAMDKKSRRRAITDKQELERFQTKREQIVQQLDVLDGMIKHLNCKTKDRTLEMS